MTKVWLNMKKGEVNVGYKEFSYKVEMKFFFTIADKKALIAEKSWQIIIHRS